MSLLSYFLKPLLRFALLAAVFLGGNSDAAETAALKLNFRHEIEGGIWVNGRHNRAAGFSADLEKYIEASLAGRRVFRLGPDQITLPVVERLAGILCQG